MGVDIAVRINLKYLGDKAPYVEDSEEDDELFASESFFRATTADELGGMEVGWYSYEYIFDEVEMEYHIGYGSHLVMRKSLSELCGEYNPKKKDYGDTAAYQCFLNAFKIKHGAFVEFITMKDTGGVFMTPVCVKLAKDFAKFRDAAKQYFVGGETGEWMARYDALHYLFEKAANNNGAVVLS